MKLLDVPIPCQMYLRDQGGGKTLVLGIVPTKRIPDNIRYGVFIDGYLTIMTDTAYDPPDGVAGWLAEDILRHEWDVKSMKQIKIGDTYSPATPAEPESKP